MNPTIHKGLDRYQRFQSRHRSIFGSRMDGRLLDFGCGAGGFLLAAVKDGQDVYGVEVDKARQTQFFRNAEMVAPSAIDRFKLYDGRLLPFPSKFFDGCFSWFVFEHVEYPQVSLREIVRVLKPGGTLTLHADDVRNAWDGHAQVPWPPYLPREFAGAYLDGLGLAERSDFISNYVVYISAPIIADILTTLGMDIVYANAAADCDPIREGLYVTSDDEARALGQKIRARAESISPRENLTVFARKSDVASS